MEIFSLIFSSIYSSNCTKEENTMDDMEDSWIEGSEKKKKKKGKMRSD